jgi:hypothetical protein
VAAERLASLVDADHDLGGGGRRLRRSGDAPKTPKPL